MIKYIIQQAIMKNPFRKQLAEPSRIINLQLQKQSVGVLTPVHVQDIVKERNLDYLQNLGQLAQKMHINPLWYECESSQNKVKLLEIYQLSINYARNTQDIYGKALSEIDLKFKTQKQKVDKLKEEMMSHKQKTLKMRKHYRKERLNKQKQKVFKYEQNLKTLRDDMLKQKKQLQMKNEISLLEEHRRQLQQKQNAKQQQNRMQANYNYPPPQYFPYMPPPNMNQYYPYPSNPLPPQSYEHQEPNNPIKQQLNKPNNNNFKRTNSDVQGGQEQQLSIVDSIINNSKGTKKNGSKNSKKQDVKQSHTSKMGNSNKNNIQDSNILESEVGQIDDLVDDLMAPLSTAQKAVPLSNSSSKMSRKSSDGSQMDINSFMDIQLKTQSKNDLKQLIKKPNHTQKQSSIVQSIGTNLGNKNKKVTIQETPINILNNSKTQSLYNSKKKQPQQSDIKSYTDNKMTIKILGTKGPQKPSLSITQTSPDKYNYLAESNQGVINGALQFSGLKGNLKLKQAPGIGNSIRNSQDDRYSKYSNRLNGNKHQQQQQYEDDFDDDLGLIQNTRIKIITDEASNSPSKNSKRKLGEFVSLYKNYFILKEDAKHLQDSVYSSNLGSLKEFNYRFVTADRKKTYGGSSIRSFQNQDDLLQMIDMPENSIIAKPSKLKQSTIRKSQIQKKIHKSYDSKMPNDFTPLEKSHTKLKIPIKSQVHQNEDSFMHLNDIQSLRSKAQQKMFDKVQILQPNNKASIEIPKLEKQKIQKSKLPKPGEQKILVPMVQSHVIDQQIQDNMPQKILPMAQSKDFQLGESLKLSVIPQSQNQSVLNPNSIRLKIVQLMDNKYKQKTFKPKIFDMKIIKEQIGSLMKNNKNVSQITSEELVDAFNQLSKIKENEIKILKQQRQKKFQDIKKQKQQQTKLKKTNYEKNVQIIENQQNQILSNLSSNNSKKRNVFSKQKLKEKFQQNIQDDLEYSTSMLENPNTYIKNEINVKSEKMKNAVVTNGTIEKKQLQSNASTAVEPKFQSKFIRETSKQGGVNNNRMLNHLKQKSKFDRDDEIQNAIKKDFSSIQKKHVEEDSQDF